MIYFLWPNDVFQSPRQMFDVNKKNVPERRNIECDSVPAMWKGYKLRRWRGVQVPLAIFLCNSFIWKDLYCHIGWYHCFLAMQEGLIAKVCMQETSRAHPMPNLLPFTTLWCGMVPDHPLICFELVPCQNLSSSFMKFSSSAKRACILLPHLQAEQTQIPVLQNMTIFKNATQHAG